MFKPLLRLAAGLLLLGEATAQVFNPAVVQPGGDDACAYDLTGDGLVSTNDLLYLLAAFGRDAASDLAADAADVNNDGVVGTSDLLALLAVYGRPCATAGGTPPPPPPPPVDLQTAAAEFAAAMGAADPYTTLVAVSSTIHFAGDLAAIATGVGRMDFEQAFATAMAANLGDGSTVSPESVIVDAIREAEAEWQQGRRLQAGAVTNIEVLFHLLVPATLQSTGASLVSMMQQTNQTIQIDIAQASFSADAASMTPPIAGPAVVDCEGSWVVSANCSEPCGPNGARASDFQVVRAAQNGGTDCQNTQQPPAAQPCNTHVQCPLECAGQWDQWGVCSLPCGNGSRTRAYVVLQEPQHGGGECPDRDTLQSQECNTQACPPPPPAAVDCLVRYHHVKSCR